MLLLLVLLGLSGILGVLLANSVRRRSTEPLQSLLGSAPPAAAAAPAAHQTRVPRTVDAALERLLESLLSEHLAPWTQEVGPDPAFLHEVRELVRCACTELLVRARRLDLASLILRRLVPVGLRHVDCCLLARRLHRSGLLTDEAAWDYYGRDAHAAVGSQGRYLRCLSGRLLPLLLWQRPCRAAAAAALLSEVVSEAVLRPLLDLVSDPDTVNQLLLLLFDEEPLDEFPPDRSPQVELLRAWTLAGRPRPGSALAVDLSGILKSADLLYALMQCLKKRGGLHLVQFCLAVEGFNQRMLNPELTEDQLRNLYTEASHIYNAYLRSDSADCVNADQAVCEQVRQVLCGSVSEITRLRRMKALFEAYEQTYNRLEQECMIDFLSSGFYLAHLCRRQAAVAVAGRGRVLRSVSAVARWGRRLRNAMRPTAVDGRLDEHAEIGEELTQDDEDEEDDDEEFDAEPSSATCDLSAWTISIPTVSMATDTFTGKQMILFVLDLSRPDPQDEVGAHQWQIARKLNEFYVLEKKLMEFHGELGDVRLPPKQNLVSSSFYTQDFLDCRKDLFVSFLRRLVQVPALAGSQLVRAFLTSDRTFVDDLQQDINFGRMIRTVPRKFRKERGQNLDAFLAAFVASTEPAAASVSRPRGRHDWTEPEPVLPLRRPGGGEASSARRPHTVPRPQRQCTVSGVYDTLTFLACRLFEAPRWLLAALLGVRPLLRHSADALVYRLLSSALTQALSPPARWQRLAELAAQALLTPRPPPRTDAQKSARAEQTLVALRQTVPPPLARALGARFEDGTRALLACLQLPQLNKQLAYVLLDQIALELFPELAGELPEPPLMAAGVSATMVT